MRENSLRESRTHLSDAALLMIGRAPPPLGGVTIHVIRLLHALRLRGVRVKLLDPRTDGLVSCFASVRGADLVHIHLSNQLLILLIVLLCNFLKKPVMFTVHGQVEASGGRPRLLMRTLIRLATKTVVLNAEALELARRESANCVQLSAYLPPCTIEEMYYESLTQEQLAELNKLPSPRVITNASTLQIDANGRDLYGIAEVVAWTKSKGLSLILCDSSGKYEPWLVMSGIDIRHVTIFSGKYSFARVASCCDVFIRNTSTDGDAISIYEAGIQGLVVWAKNCVPRPAFVKCYNNLEEVDEKLRSGAIPELSNPTPELIKIYAGLLDAK